MKRKNVLKILLFIVTIIVMPKNVFAIECDLTQNRSFTEEGEYVCTLTDDLDLDQLDSKISISAGTVTINLNGHSIVSNIKDPIEVTGSGSLIINGTGNVINGSTNIVNDCEAIRFSSSGNLIINGGTFKGERGLNVVASNEVKIKDAKISGKKYDGIGISSTLKIIIDGSTEAEGNARGLFINGYGESDVTINNGKMIGENSGAFLINIKKLQIKGGIFEGNNYGIQLNDIKNLDNSALYGGTFICNNQDDIENSGAIDYYYTQQELDRADKDIFNKLIAKGYKYSERFDVEESGENEIKQYVSKVKKLSIIQDDKDQGDNNSSEEKNVETGSKLYIYIIIFLFVCGVSLFITYKYQKKQKD